MQKIVVTGATSMLGVATIEECLRNNIDVVAIVHRDSKNVHRLPQSPNLTIIESNLDEFSTCTPNFDDADVFYHFAWAETSKEGRVNADYQAKNIQHTLDAVHLAHKCGCRKFIFAGSQAEYGLNNKPLNRETPIKPHMAYGIAKYAAGKLSEILCSSLGIPFVWCRIVSTYGTNDRSDNLFSYLIDCYKKNIQPILTKCEQKLDYLHCEDAARAFRLLGQCQTQGVYVIGSGLAQPLKFYVETIYRLMKPNVPLIFGGKPYTENQVMFLQADISDLQRDTGFQPLISFEEGIKKILSNLKV